MKAPRGLTWSQVAEIRVMVFKGVRQAVLARIYKISPSTIWRVAHLEKFHKQA